MTLPSPARPSRSRASTWPVLAAVLGSVALSLVPGTASAAPAERDNLALNRTVTSSSSYEDTGWGWFANAAVDGVTGSSMGSRGWSSNSDIGADHTEWFQIDLGADTTVNEVVLWPRGDDGDTGYGFPVEGTVATSTDGSTWTTVANVGRPEVSAAPETVTFDRQTARYVRITGTTLQPVVTEYNAYRMQFAEVQVFDAAATTPPTSEPTSAPVTGEPVTPPPAAGTVTPLADCYTSNADGSYTVVLGYTNPTASTVTIPAGRNNTFTPVKYNEALPTTFDPGTHHGVAKVTVAAADVSRSLSWRLDGTTLSTTSNVPACSTSELPMLANGAAVAGLVALAGIVGAVGVRRQRQRAHGAELTGRA